MPRRVVLKYVSSTTLCLAQLIHSPGVCTGRIGRTLARIGLALPLICTSRPAWKIKGDGRPILGKVRPSLPDAVSQHWRFLKSDPGAATLAKAEAQRAISWPHWTVLPPPAPATPSHSSPIQPLLTRLQQACTILSVLEEVELSNEANLQQASLLLRPCLRQASLYNAAATKACCQSMMVAWPVAAPGAVFAHQALQVYHCHSSEFTAVSTSCHT